MRILVDLELFVSISALDLSGIGETARTAS